MSEIKDIFEVMMKSENLNTHEEFLIHEYKKMMMQRVQAESELQQLKLKNQNVSRANNAPYRRSSQHFNRRPPTGSTTNDDNTERNAN